ncbi:MAG: ABC transporter ATP-binding protein [Gammaproteobacteria bacterium]
MPNAPPGLHIDIRQQLPMPLVARFDCAPGELLALVGPSGAGKTSLLRVISGLMRPAQGRIRIGTMLWCDTAARIFVPPQERHLGLVFQNYALMPHLCALDNVGLSLLELPRRQRRLEAARWLDHVHLEAAQHSRRPEHLSGGQQQRVAIARALARSPRLLLLDEPFSAVDHLTRRGLYHLLADLRQNLSIPIILVTHNLHEARMLADRMAVMDRGEVMQVGTPDAIYKAPRNARVADLMGIDNRFQGVWDGPADEPGWGWLHWCLANKKNTTVPRLRVHDKGKIPRGQTIHWIIPSEGITIVDGSADRPDRFTATLIEARHLGELTLSTLALDLSPDTTVQLILSGPERRRIIPGTSLTLHFDLSMVHVMPFRQ